jgi:hypothetical protein
MLSSQQLTSQLVYRDVLSDLVMIKVPAEFKEMDTIMKNIKYPGKNGPEDIYTNEATTINIALKKSEIKLLEAEVYEQGKLIEKGLSGKGYKMEQSEQLMVNDNHVHLFGFISDAIDMKIYNLMFIFSLKDKLVMGTFNCPEKLRDTWEKDAMEMIRSIKKK